MKTLDENLIIAKNIDFNNYPINLLKDDDPILCNHCLRTASNGIRCMGICVADNEYWRKDRIYFSIIFISFSA